MASNCPYWKNKKCAGTNNDYFYWCSLDTQKYEDCAVYKMIKVKAAGGTGIDMLRGAGLVGQGTVIGGDGPRLSDEKLDALTGKKSTTAKGKKWWKLWR